MDEKRVFLKAGKDNKEERMNFVKPKNSIEFLGDQECLILDILG